MRTYAAEGRRGEALRQYQHCEQVLQSELGVAPMAETTDLFYTLLRGEPPSVNERGENVETDR
jgi:LuxR family maltose regulon positive regulatory protein